MSTWGDIENQFVTQLQSVTYDAGPAFNSVRGYMIARNESLPTPMLRERMPAAYVTVRSMFYDPDFYSLVRYLSVFIGVRNLRSQDDARHNLGNAPGLFTLMQLANAEFDGASMPGSHVAYLSGASTVSADPNTLVVRLTYTLYSSFYGAVTMDGSTLPDQDSIAWLVPGSPSNRTVDFVFPGSKGLLRQVIGTIPRTVEVRGILRAADEAALQVKEAELEALACDLETHTLGDSSGRALSDCVARSYERLGVPTQRWGGLPVSQWFVLRFEQLAY